MTDFEVYPRNRKIIRKDEYFIILPISYEKDKEKMPLFCEVCGYAFSSIDEDSYKHFQCCTSCADMWAYKNKESWLKGWRPSLDEMSSYLEKRSIINFDLILE